jgi:hypothetical protein
VESIEIPQLERKASAKPREVQGMTMKRALAGLVLLMLVAMIPNQATDISEAGNSSIAISSKHVGEYSTSDIGGGGDSFQSNVYFSRRIDGLSTSIMNSFIDTTDHSGFIDLSQYHIPGWTLYNTTLNMENLTAIAEREAIGVSKDIDSFRIEEYDSWNSWRYTSLAQGFYTQVHNGSLLNYSFYYDSPIYSPAQHNWAYYSLLSDYGNSSSNLVSYTQLPSRASSVAGWENASASSVILDSETEYYVVINGSSLVNTTFYPYIIWNSETGAGDFTSQQYDSRFSAWGSYACEALLNYTYVPWNKTSSSPLLFQSEEVDLSVNETAINGDTWTHSGENTSYLRLATNQSVNLNYNLTLWYEKSTSSLTTWEVPVSGGSVIWNQSVLVRYPGFSDFGRKYVNFTGMVDWAPTGLYNGSSDTDYGNFTSVEETIVCQDMTNGSWTLVSDAPNYVTDIAGSDNSDATPLSRKVNILTDLDIDVSIEDGIGNPADTGTTNLTAYNSTMTVYAPSNKSVTSGSVSYLWDINLTTTKNGSYSIAVYWTNGTEAGYLTKTYLVYLPTAFMADSYSLAAHTESSFDIRVHFDDTYSGIGLNSTYASVSYSFDGESNVSMTDGYDNGTWTASISTTGRNPGTYPVDVYGEGYGIENQSLTITVELTVATLPLEYSWSNSNNISYVEHSTLKVNYSMYNGTEILDATIEITIGLDTWTASWNASSSTYDLAFNGTDNPPGIGTFTVDINATKVGHDPRTSSIILTIHQEPTSLKSNWVSNSFDWTQSAYLRFNFTDSYGTLIPGADQRDVYINGSLYSLTDAGNGTYYILLDNSFDLGHHTVVANLSKSGYIYGEFTGIAFEITEASTALSVTWQPVNVTIDYSQRLNLTVEYTHESSSVPVSSIVNVTINGVTFDLNWTGTDWYGSIPGSSIGIGVFDADISAWLYGYAQATNTTIGVNITEAPNTFFVQWSPSDLNATYIEVVNVTVTYTFEYDPILGATVQLILNDTRTYDLTYSDIDEKWHITLLASEIDLGIYNATVRANKTGYDTGYSMEYLEIVEDTPLVSALWTELILEYAETGLWIVNVSSSNSSFLTGVTVDFLMNDTQLVVSDFLNGTYSVIIPHSMHLGYYVCDVNITKYGFVTQRLGLNLTIIESLTELILDVADATPYFDENSTIRVYYELLNGTNISPANITFELNGVPQSLTERGMFWDITFQGSTLGIGTHDCFVNVSAYGYVFQTNAFSIEVLEIPTWLNITGSTWLYVNSTASFQVSLLDFRDNTTIPVTSDPISWTGGHSWTAEDDSQYLLEIDSNALSNGNYPLTVTVDIVGYALATSELDIAVLSVPVDLDTDGSLSIFENETLELSVQIRDTYHDAIIHWADVQVTFGDDVYNFSYDSEQEIYIASIWMGPDIAPRTDYVLVINSEAEDCESMQVVVRLTVREKQTYELVLQPDSAALIGRSFGVTAVLTEDGSPVEGKEIRVWAEFTINGDEELVHLTAITNQNGIAQVNFDVPESTTSLTIWGEFVGSEAEWSITTSQQDISVERADLLTLFAGFITSVEGLFLLIAITVFVGAYVGYTRKHKPKKLAAIRSLEQQIEAFRDLESLQHFMAIYLDRGTCVFYHPFRDSRIEPDLISGFIAAITSVYGEIKGNGVKGSLEEIHYQGLRLNCYSGRYIISILILEREMTPILKDRLQFFTEMFEQTYESDLHEWVGSVDCFDPAWVIENLYSAFHYSWVLPHKVGNLDHASRTERKIIEFIEERNEGEEFLIGDHLEDLANEFGRTEAEMLDKLLSMEDDEFIEPISIQTVLQRQGLGLSGIEEEEGAKKVVSQDVSAEVVSEDEIEDEDTDVEGPSVDDAETISEQEEAESEEDLEPEKEKQPEPEAEEDVDEKELFISEVEGLLAKKKSSETDEESDSD